MKMNDDTIIVIMTTLLALIVLGAIWPRVLRWLVAAVSLTVCLVILLVVLAAALSAISRAAPLHGEEYSYRCAGFKVVPPESNDLDPVVMTDIFVSYLG